jgi:hypothetical protein
VFIDSAINSHLSNVLRSEPEQHLDAVQSRTLKTRSDDWFDDGEQRVLQGRRSEHVRRILVGECDDRSVNYVPRRTPFWIAAVEVFGEAAVEYKQLQEDRQC